jgi:hypothetical protein
VHGDDRKKERGTRGITRESDTDVTRTVIMVISNITRATKRIRAFSYKYRNERRYSTLQTVHSSSDRRSQNRHRNFICIRVATGVSARVATHVATVPYTEWALQVSPRVSADTLTDTRLSRCNKDEIKFDDYENVWFSTAGAIEWRRSSRERR